MLEACPLCKAPLKKWNNETHITFGCDAVNCVYDGMPKFMVSYTPDLKELVSHVWWLDGYYIRIDYKEKNTTISKIMSCFLMDPIVLPQILEVDPANPQKTARRLDTLMYFS